MEIEEERIKELIEVACEAYCKMAVYSVSIDDKLRKRIGAALVAIGVINRIPF